jgi:hypothetical protein
MADALDHDELREAMQVLSAHLQEHAHSAALDLQDQITEVDDTIPRWPYVADADIDPPNRIPTPDDIPDLEKVPWNPQNGAFNADEYKRSTYVSPFFQYLEPKLIEIIDGNYVEALTQNFDMLYDHQKERDLQTLNEALDVSASRYGKRGFPLPPDMLNAQQTELIEKYRFDKTNRGREIATQLVERMHDAIKNAMAVGVKMEDIQSQFSLNFAVMLNNFINSEVAQFRAAQEARIAEFEGQLKKIMAEVEVGRINEQLDRNYQEQLLKKWQIEANIEFKKVDTEIEQGKWSTEQRIAATEQLMNFYKGYLDSIWNTENYVSLKTETTQTN